MQGIPLRRFNCFKNKMHILNIILLPILCNSSVRYIQADSENRHILLPQPVLQLHTFYKQSVY